MAVLVSVIFALSIGLGIYYLNPAGNYSPTTTISTTTTVGAASVCQNLPSVAEYNATSNPQSKGANFAIIMADIGPFAGMNGSANALGYHMQYSTETVSNQSSPKITNTSTVAAQHAPVITVYEGQLVTIHVYNCATSEPHGFTIQSYVASSSNSTLILSPDESGSVSFTANRVGNFSVYEPIFSVIHPFMQSGLLVVENASPS